MSLKSINEPDAVGRTTMLFPVSINEPPDLDMPDAPEISSLDPSSATIGDPSFRLYVRGSGFYNASVINFAGHDEPTTLEEDGSLSTGVNMEVWQGPDVLPVIIYNGTMVSNTLEFEFTAAGQGSRVKTSAKQDEDERKAHAKASAKEDTFDASDPDEMEAAIEEEQDDEFKPLR